MELCCPSRHRRSLRWPRQQWLDSYAQLSSAPTEDSIASAENARNSERLARMPGENGKALAGKEGRRGAAGLGSPVGRREAAQQAGTGVPATLC